MKKRTWVILGSVAALAVVGLTAFAAVGGFGGKGFWGRGVGARGEIGALLMINALELSEEQMQALLELTAELAPLREQILAREDELKAKLIAFKGTRAELQTLLKEFRDETQKMMEEFADKAVAGLQEILTEEQWNLIGWGVRARVGAQLAPMARGRMPLRGMPMGPWSRAPRWEEVRTQLQERGAALWLFRHLPELESALKAKLGL